VLVFRKFAELGSIRQVHLWLRHEAMELPAQTHELSQRRIVWKLPVYNSVYHILTNPVYAGAYVFGRSRSRTWLEDGRTRVVRGIRRERDDREVLIRDHHQGYISWADYERNQQLIADNATCHGAAARGPVRKGEGLLAGLLRCGHCGRNLHVAYSGEHGNTLRYHCRGAHLNHGTERCISFGGYRVNQAVGQEVLRALGPLAMEAALHAIGERDRRSIEVLQQAELALEAARFEERRARRQYDAVDPDNRLVAGELERRWNDRLTVVRQREQTVSGLRQRAERDTLSVDERNEYLALGADLERAWTHERASPESRKRILRAVLVEVVATVQGNRIHLRLHWQGGDHTELTVRKHRTGNHRWTTDVETGALIAQLARLMRDRSIANLLTQSSGQNNREGESLDRSARPELPHLARYCVYREGEREERGELTLQEAAERLGVSKMTVLREIRRGVIPACQACKGAPWVIATRHLEAAQLARTGARHGPVTMDRRQKTLAL